MDANLINTARAIAIVAHAGQTDKGGDPYWHHPEAVAEIVADLAKDRDEEERTILIIAAFLHDVLEDTEVTRQDLIEAGIPLRSIILVEIVSKRDGETYEDFIERISVSVWASILKVADLTHNLDPNRRWQPGASHRARYLAARARLNEAIG